MKYQGGGTLLPIVLMHLGFIQMCTTVYVDDAFKTPANNNEGDISKLFQKMAEMQNQIDSLKRSETSFKQSIRSLTETNMQLREKIQQLEERRVAPHMVNAFRSPEQTVPRVDDTRDANTRSDIGGDETAKTVHVNKTPLQRSKFLC